MTTAAGAPASFEEFEVDADGPRLIVRPMLTTSQAADLFLGVIEGRGYSERTVDTYRRLLYKFCDEFPAGMDIARVTQDDCQRWLRTAFKGKAAGTRAHAFSVLSSFFKFLALSEPPRIKRNPLERIERPRRIPAEDLDVVTVSEADVRRLLEVAEPGAEKLAVALAIYTGARRRALARLRLTDYDRDSQRLRFNEKGGKVIWKPVPYELGHILEAAITAGTITEPDGYLIPSRGALTRNGERDDRVVWRLITDVAKAAGVKAHVHSLRAAFACFYLSQPDADLHSLKDLLGHRSLTTTQVYLRKLDKQAGMERVRSLSWAGNSGPTGLPQTAGEWLASSPGVGAGGFEPPSDDSRLVDRAGTEHDRSGAV